jgi:hypothetical protein
MSFLVSEEALGICVLGTAGLASLSVVALPLAWRILNGSIGSQAWAVRYSGVRFCAKQNPAEGTVHINQYFRR